MPSPNGAVMLGREMHIRLDPMHLQTLNALAKRNGWNSPTEFAEALLHDAIERTARNVSMQVFFARIQESWLA